MTWTVRWSLARTIGVLTTLLAFDVAATGRQERVFRSGVDMIEVNVSVTSKSRAVTDLTVDDFAVEDNGVPQKILDISSQTMAIDLTLILDTSATGSTVGRSLSLAVNRIRDSLGPADRVSLVTFNHRVEELFHLRPATAPPPVDSPWTRQGPIAFGESALYDAVVLALPRLISPDRRQLAILYTAGPDTISFADEAAALEVARRSAAAIFVVGATVDPNPLETRGLDDPLSRGNQSGRLSGPSFATERKPADFIFGSRPLPMRFLRDLVADTGGEMQVIEPAVYVANSRSHFDVRATVERNSVADFFLRAINAFRAGYVVRYAAQGVARNGWHDLRVRVTRRGTSFDIRARRGYDAGS